MDISISAKPSGRFVFKLYDDICPKTCENFRALCTGEKGKTNGGITLHYLHSLFHRIVPNGWIQGGGKTPTNVCSFSDVILTTIKSELETA